MKLPANIKDAEPWGADDKLPPGVYVAKIASIEESKSKAGNEMLVITWRIDEGEWRGAEIRDWVTVIESTAGRVVSLLQALEVEIPADGMLEPTKLAGKGCEIVVRAEDWTDKDGELRESTKVKGYRVRDLAPGSDVPSGGFPAVGVGAGVSDDDVPFAFEPLPEFEQLKATRRA
jgi:hypothetical protein